MSKTFSFSAAEKREVEHQLFTPYVGHGQRLRAHMEISDKDYQAFQDLPKGNGGTTIQVFDLVSQSFYLVRRADCGALCFCAGEIVSKG